MDNYRLDEQLNYIGNVDSHRRYEDLDIFWYCSVTGNNLWYV
jgi:hypothetical protein